jgi:L-lactate dehydrogenase (cytochrome)
MTLPPSLTLKTILDASYRPEWWFNFLTTKPLGFANFESSRGSVTEQANGMFDPSLNFDDLAWLRANWAGKLIVKGIQTPQDAVKVFGLGADAIIVSNHGGRQLDRAPVPLRSLPEIRSAVGPGAEIILDSGIMSGGDIIAAIAAGADFTLVGRAYLYGLMAGGQQGVERMLQILQAEMAIVMQLLGVSSLAELTPEHVREVR